MGCCPIGQNDQKPVDKNQPQVQKSQKVAQESCREIFEEKKHKTEQEMPKSYFESKERQNLRELLEKVEKEAHQKHLKELKKEEQKQVLKQVQKEIPNKAPETNLNPVRYQDAQTNTSKLLGNSTLNKQSKITNNIVKEKKVQNNKENYAYWEKIKLHSQVSDQNVLKIFEETCQKLCFQKHQTKSDETDNSAQNSPAFDAKSGSGSVKSLEIDDQRRKSSDDVPYIRKYGKILISV